MTNPNDPFNPTYNEGYLVKSGISKRDYFAAQAMMGLLATNFSVWSDIPRDSVEMADKLIEELNKTETK